MQTSNLSREVISCQEAPDSRAGFGKNDSELSATDSVRVQKMPFLSNRVRPESGGGGSFFLQESPQKTQDGMDACTGPNSGLPFCVLSSFVESDPCPGADRICLS